MKNLHAIILAAGKGTRMKSDIPKVLHEVCGQPIIQYVLDVVKAVGSLKTYVVLGHKSDEVKAHLPKESIVVEQKQLLGTADAVKSADSYFKNFSGNTLILCGDTPLLQKDVIKEVVKRHKKTKAVCTILTAVVHNPSGYGRIIRDQDNKAVAIREDRDATGLERDIAEINVGVYCFDSKQLFKALKTVQQNKNKKEYYLTDVVEIFATMEMRIETILTDDPSEGLGVNSRADLAYSESVIQQRILKKLMDQGVTIQDPKTTYIDANVRIGRDTIIRPCTVIEHDVKIGSGCKIGPFARIRPQTKIGRGVELGNFTEVSRSSLGDKSIMKHFSYLGDTQTGTSVNIGAGAVTANYDGKSKSATKILDNAFIGSDAILIAPVKVGKGAIVGAGSVVVKKNIPDGCVAIGVPANIIKKGKK